VETKSTPEACAPNVATNLIAARQLQSND